MTCKYSFRTNSPFRILRAVSNEQRKLNGAPKNDTDFVKLNSREVIKLANIGISDAAMYANLTKLAVSGHLSVHSNPEHKQGIRYSITPQGMRCTQCHLYQEGIEPAPTNFRCGALPMDV